MSDADNGHPGTISPHAEPSESVLRGNTSAGNPCSGGSYHSGRWVVIALFIFAGALTLTNYIYWKLHVGPFLPLQQQLAEHWPGSKPLVEGGQRKMHRNTPKILRITMKIDFNPTTKAGRQRAEHFAREVAAFVSRVYEPLSDYELLELHFYWPEAEKKILQVSITLKVPALLSSRSPAFPPSK